MIQFPEQQGAIYIDEVHKYDVDLSSETIFKWEGSEISIKVLPPYDEQPPHDRTSEPDIQFGKIKLSSPDGTEIKNLTVSVPAKALSFSPLIKGKRAVWHRKHSLGQEPNELPLAIEAEVFDGASTDPKRLRNLIFKNTSAFVNELRLQISIWAADVFEMQQGISSEEQLQEMLSQRQHAGQILLPNFNNSKKLAKSLVALANNPTGGRILLGVDQKGHVVGLSGKIREEEYKNEIEIALLKAALRSTPAIPLLPPDFFENSYGDNEVIARIIVDGNTKHTYRIGNTVYRRKGIKIVEEEGPITDSSTPSIFTEIDDLEAIIQDEPDDVIILDTNDSLNKLELGPYISGLINAGEPHGLIVLRTLPQASSGSILKTLETRLQSALEQLIPKLPLQKLAPRIQQIGQTEKEQLALIPVSSRLAPVALYKNRGYLWTERSLKRMKSDEVFKLYLKRIHGGSINLAGTNKVEMVYGELLRPIQPPSTANPSYEATSLDSEKAVHVCRYDAQRQAMVWGGFPLTPSKDLGGSQCTLVAPLRHALVKSKENGEKKIPDLDGFLRMRFDNVLISGLDVRIEDEKTADDHEAIALSDLPIYKQSNLFLKMTVAADALFRHRTKMSLLRFSLLDTALDKDRVADLKEICADLGFKIYYSEFNPDGPAILIGIRNKNYYDISLLIAIRPEETPLTRELKYKQRIDRKETITGLLDCRVLLWGAGEHVMTEMVKLQLYLSQLVEQRLQYLRME